MRSFIRFKVGDRVKPINSPRFWFNLTAIPYDPEREFTVIEVRYDTDPHAYEDSCDSSNCIHKLSHPDLYRFDIDGMADRWSSGSWFDPNCSDEIDKEEEKLDART